MGSKSQRSFEKRQRERKKAEKAAAKRAQRAVRRDDPASPADATEPESREEDGEAEVIGIVEPS